MRCPHDTYVTLKKIQLYLKTLEISLLYGCNLQFKIPFHSLKGIELKMCWVQNYAHLYVINTKIIVYN
jgi:hypothetical protein